MKKLLVLSSLLATVATSAFANISVNGFTFGNGGANGAVFFDTVGGTPADATVKVDFLFGASSGSLTDASSVFTIQAGTGGFLNAGVINVTSSNVGGGPGFYVMRAWTGGATYDDIANTKKGTSGAATAITFGGTPLLGGTPLGVPDLNLHASFAITSVVVPEPATLALGLFGVAGLLARRRK